MKRKDGADSEEGEQGADGGGRSGIKCDAVIAGYWADRMFCRKDLCFDCLCVVSESESE